MEVAGRRESQAGVSVDQVLTSSHPGLGHPVELALVVQGLIDPWGIGGEERPSLLEKRLHVGHHRTPQLERNDAQRINVKKGHRDVKGDDHQPERRDEARQASIGGS